MRKKDKQTAPDGPTKSSFRMTARGLTDIGLVRKLNQDYLALDAASGVYVVADGMGGHAAGDEASSTAVEAIIRILAEDEHLPKEIGALEQAAQPITESIIRAMEGANREIMAKSGPLMTWLMRAGLL